MVLGEWIVNRGPHLDLSSSCEYGATKQIASTETST